jgi:prepilin-type N-terminal cleavage/methylation domain-containing protein
MRTRRSQHGFTLIEMMVVVAIVAILSGLLISASSRPVGASARSVSETLVSTINFAKLRSQSTRRIHRVMIENTRISVWEFSTTGLAMPVTSNFNTLVQNIPIPKGVTIVDVTASPVISTGATPTFTSLVAPGTAYSLDVRPDGQATASTVYIDDGVHKWRVITYHVTGGTYAREYW